MTSKSALMRGAAVGVLLAVGLGASAQAATVHKKAHRPTAAEAANKALMDQVQALSTQVQALQSRLDAQAQAQQQTQAQVAATQTQVADANTKVDKVVADSDSVEQRLDDVPTQVLATLSEVPKPPKSWTDNTVVSGRMYYDLSNIEQKNNGVKVPATGTGFDIKRLYIGIDHKFNDTYSANVTTDMQYSSAVGATELYLKKAYLQAKYSDALIIQLGANDLPWVPFVEDIYGYRYLENTLTEHAKMATSSDWGLHVLGKLGPYISYNGAIIDGAGYKAPVRSKTMDVEGRVNATYNGFTVAVGGYSGKLGKDTVGTAVYHTASRFDALAAYVQGPIRVGLEYYTANDWNNVTTVAQDKTEGYSAFGSFALTPVLSVFGRYDWVKPRKTTTPTVTEDYFNVGLQYEPVKIIDLSLVYKREKADNGSVVTSNGTIGGSLGGTYDEVGLFGQVRY